MADQPTRKDFENLVKAQQETNRLMREQAKADAESNTKAASFTTNFGEILTEARGQVVAKSESDQTQEVLKKNEEGAIKRAEESGKREDKQTSFLRALLFRGRKNASAEEEIRNEDGIKQRKRDKLFTAIAKGMTSITNWTKAKVKGAASSLWKIIKGTFFAAFLAGLLIFLNSKYWPMARDFMAKALFKFKEWVVNLDWDTAIDKLKENFKAIALAIGGLALLLTLGAIFGIPGLVVGAGLIGGLALYFGWNRITDGFEGIKAAFCEIGVQLENWQIVLGGLIVALAGPIAFIKGMQFLLRKTFGWGPAAVKAAEAARNVPRGTATFAQVAQRMTPGTVLNTGGGNRAIWLGQQFAAYTGDVRAGRVVPENMRTGAHGVGSILKTEDVGRGATAGRFKGISGKAMRMIQWMGNLPGLKRFITTGLLLNAFLSSGGNTDAFIANVVGLYAGYKGAGLGALAGAGLGAMAGAPLGPLAFFSSLIGGTIGWFGSQAIGTAVAQKILGIPIDAFSLPKFMGGEYFNDLLNGKPTDDFFGLEGKGPNQSNLQIGMGSLTGNVPDFVVTPGGTGGGIGVEPPFSMGHYPGLRTGPIMEDVLKQHGMLPSMRSDYPFFTGMRPDEMRMIGDDPLGLRSSIIDIPLKEIENNTRASLMNENAIVAKLDMLVEQGAATMVSAPTVISKDESSHVSYGSGRTPIINNLPSILYTSQQTTVAV